MLRNHSPCSISCASHGPGASHIAHGIALILSTCSRSVLVMGFLFLLCMSHHDAAFAALGDAFPLDVKHIYLFVVIEASGVL